MSDRARFLNDDNDTWHYNPSRSSQSSQTATLHGLRRRSLERDFQRRHPPDGPRNKIDHPSILTTQLQNPVGTPGRLIGAQRSGHPLCAEVRHGIDGRQCRLAASLGWSTCRHGGGGRQERGGEGGGGQYQRHGLRY